MPLALLATYSPAHAAVSGVQVRAVIVATSGNLAAANAAAVRLGGSVVETMPAVNESVVLIDSAAASALAADPAVAALAPDQAMSPLSSTYNPVTDVGSMTSTATITGARSYWAAGFTGRGVDVALIDTGIVPVAGLQGRVINGPDLSFNAGFTQARFLDEYGHGTFMAGIIAGRDSAATAPYADASQFVGMAPESRLVNLKVADQSGTTTVARVIAAIEWTVEHRNDNGMNIRVINLAFGTNSSAPWSRDPLALAVQAAWADGIVVVTSAGNAGTGSHQLTDPAYAPNVIAVGAADTQATMATADDTVAAFSSTGDTRHPDVVAPGTHIVSLRDPGSYIDKNYSSTGAVSDRFFRGSGTSQSAAVVSGEAALLLSQHPALSPDAVKAMLVGAAVPIAKTPATRQGAGEVLMTSLVKQTVPKVEANAGRGEGDGNGRGNNGNDTWSGNTWSGNTWSGNTWSGNTWSGNTWSGNTWSGNTWSGNTWSGNTWSGNTWSGNTWSGNTWSGNTWSGNTWSGNTWSGNTWSGNTWSGNTWSGNTWSADDWE